MVESLLLVAISSFSQLFSVTDKLKPEIREGLEASKYISLLLLLLFIIIIDNNNNNK